MWNVSCTLYTILKKTYKKPGTHCEIYIYVHLLHITLFGLRHIICPFSLGISIIRNTDEAV